MCHENCQSKLTTVALFGSIRYYAIIENIYDLDMMSGRVAFPRTGGGNKNLCLGGSILVGRNIVTFVDVYEIQGALGNGVGCHDGEAGVSGLRSWMQSR